MASLARSRLAIVTGAALLLAAALLGPVFLYPRAAWFFVAPRDRPLVDRTLREGAAIFNTTPDRYRWTTRPVVTRLSDRTCVTLDSGRRDGAGSYLTCYDPRNGHVVEKRATGGF